jgi:serine beta-lactamase-like protein LACTB
MTGVLAAKMAQEGLLDLDADLRELLPEFTQKKYPVSARQLLGRLGGIVHYLHMPVVTRRDYGVDFPFRDAVRAIDMFCAAPLINQPGTVYSYSTHGFALAGAVLERSSKRGYWGEVQSLVSAPLGMSSFEPDDPSAPNVACTTGYRIVGDGRIFDAGNSNVAWKLAGGGLPVHGGGPGALRGGPGR